MDTLEDPLTVVCSDTERTPCAAMDSGGLGDAALARIFSKYGVLILRWAGRIFRDGMTAEDVLHDVMLKLMRKGAIFETLAGEAQKRAWLHRTTLRVCWDMKSRHRRERHGAEEAIALGELGQAMPFEARQMLDGLCQRLSVEERILAVLYFEEGYTKMEIHELTRRSRPFIDKKLDHIATELAHLQEGMS